MAQQTFAWRNDCKSVRERSFGLGTKFAMYKQLVWVTWLQVLGAHFGEAYLTFFSVP